MTDNNENEIKEVTHPSEIGAMQATHADIVKSAREHYEDVSSRAFHWSSTIVHAIDAYEREPELLERLRAETQRADAAEGEREDARNKVLAIQDLYASACQQLKSLGAKDVWLREQAAP